MDLFDRNGVWPAVRKATIEYRAPAFARDLLRVETTVAGRGTTSMTLRHVVRRVSDDATVAEADIVFVCIDRLGRATPIPEEIARFLGPRTPVGGGDRKSTRLNSSHGYISYAVFCLKKKKKKHRT